ncbi:MAG TPA: hypothetical protein VFZ38_19455 [Vicinamibacterales bacterium]
MRDANDARYWLTWAGSELRGPGEAPTAAVARELGVSERTVRHWHQANQAPPYAVRALFLLVNGMSPAAADTWRGWTFRRDGARFALAGPDGSTWLPDDLYRFADTHAHLRCLQEALRPGSQLRWEAPGAGARNAWPGGSVPTWFQLEDALRAVIDDAMRRATYRGAAA